MDSFLDYRKATKQENLGDINQKSQNVGFSGNGIVDASKKGDKLSMNYLPGADDTSLYCDETKKGKLSMNYLPGADDESLYKSF